MYGLGVYEFPFFLFAFVPLLTRIELVKAGRGRSRTSSSTCTRILLTKWRFIALEIIAAKAIGTRAPIDTDKDHISRYKFLDFPSGVNLTLHCFFESCLILSFTSWKKIFAVFIQRYFQIWLIKRQIYEQEHFNFLIFHFQYVR